jgi:molecular chaperone DnaK
MPQIEVTFEIDANGILNVKAVDKGTKKQQTIRIESSSGLSKEEIERMRRDAESHAAEDKTRREVVDLRNQADHVLHLTEKELAEHRGKMSAADAQAIEEAAQGLKKAKEGEDKDAIQRALSELQSKAQKLGEAVYREQQAASNASAGAQGEPGAGPTESGSGKGRDEPVDADFEVKT